jgi:mRNA interferase HigB
MMRLLGLGKLDEYSVAHTDTKNWLENWISDAKGSTWNNPQDIKQKYSTASFLANNTVIFNVRGNNHRLVVQVAYGAKTIAILWIGTHAEYTRRYG